MDPSERLADYGLTLDENIVICDRRIVDEAVTALANLEAENARLRARVAVMEKALREELVFHEDQDKALSKQPPSHGPSGTLWARIQHQERMTALRAALTPTKENDQ